AASGLWFMGLQKFLIKSYCYYCMSVHTCGVIIAILVLKSIPGTTEETVKKKVVRVEQIPAQQRTVAALAGIIAVGVLAGGQIWARRVEAPAIPTPPATSPAPVSRPVTQAPTTSTSVAREAVLVNGTVRFTMGDFPIFGSPDAQNIVAHFFDFTCPACRQFHP